MSHFFYSISALLCFSCVAISAQTPVLDSLHNALKTAKEDTAKINFLFQLAGSIQGIPNTSRQYAETAYNLAMRLGDKRRAADAKNWIAYCYFDMSNFSESQKAATEALALAQAIDNKSNIADAYMNLSNVDNAQGNLDKALELRFKVLSMAEEAGSLPGKAMALTGIGGIYTDMQQYKRAREYFQQVLSISESMGNKTSQMNDLNNIGDSYMKERQYDSALACFFRAFALASAMQENVLIPSIRTNIGETYMHIGKLADADTALAQALTILQKTQDKPLLVYALRVYSELKIKQRLFSEAISYGARALALADSIGARLYKREVLKALSEAYTASGNVTKAFTIYKDYILLRDSLVNEETTKRAAYRENKYAADKKDAEIKLLKKDAENQVLVRNSMAGGLVLVGSLVGVLVISNSRRKKANILLQSQAAQIQLANTELQQKNIEITEAHMETQRLFTNVQDSIRYAKRIQDAMLPSTETLNRLLPEHFIFFRPKDVVSGDFYWCRERDGNVFVAAVDCTGHGVPGAFMSLIGNALLNDIVQRLPDPHPDLVLNELHHELQTVLRQKETNNDDGMDICLCMIDPDTRIVEFAGAINPLYAVIQGELREFKGTPEELGGRDERSPVYTRHVLDVSDVPHGATMLYLASDGYKDQYNEVRQRFMPKRLRPLLTEIAAKPLEEQPGILGATIDAHRGEVIQVDDMLVLGVRL